MYSHFRWKTGRSLPQSRCTQVKERSLFRAISVDRLNASFRDSGLSTGLADWG